MTTTSATTHSSPTPALAGRTAVVTGAGTGIGAATATLLAERGAQVALLGRRQDRLDAVATPIDALAVATDVADRPALETAAAHVRHRLGPVDLVVANAGAMLAAPFEAADRQEWRRMLDVNVLGLADTAQVFLPDLLRAAGEGRASDLVLISSIGAHVVIPSYAMYMATKAAVTQLSHVLRAELGERGVRVHAIEPGMTTSDLGTDMADEESRALLHDFVDRVPPMPAVAIAEGVAWSASLPVGVNAAALEILPTHQG